MAMAAAQRDFAYAIELSNRSLVTPRLTGVLTPIVRIVGVAVALWMGVPYAVLQLKLSATSVPAVWVLAALLCLVNVVHTFGFLGSIGRDRSRLALSTPVTAGYESAPEGSKPRRNATTKDLLATIPGFKGLTLEALIRERLERDAAKRQDPLCMGKRIVEKAVRVEGPGGKPAVQYKLGRYQYWSYKSVVERAEFIGAGLFSLGVRSRERVALYASTSMDWMTSAIACFLANVTVATSYATLGMSALVHSLDETEVKVIIADGSLLPTLVKCMNGLDVEGRMVLLRRLKHVVVIRDMALEEPNTHREYEAAAAALRAREGRFGGPIEVHTLDEIESRGRDAPDAGKDVVLPLPQDVAVIMYTSGSTALPKGVVIHHSHIVGVIGGYVPALPDLGPTDRYLSYLPLAHILELAAELTLLLLGTRLCYASPFTFLTAAPGILPDSGTVGDAVAAEPTLMAGVPAVFDRVRNAVTGQIKKKGGAVAKLFDLGFRFKSEMVRRNGMAGLHSPFWDGLVFGKIKNAALGGKLRLILSGGGPLSPDTQRFMQIVFSTPLMQGYGLTETCGGGALAWCSDDALGEVGPPICCNDLKLVDWEEGGYRTTVSADRPRPQGEICYRGTNVSAGYFKNDAKTREDFRVHADGQVWFHSGDIGEWSEAGTLKIIDRKKDLVKLSRGEYVSYGKIESNLKAVTLIENIAVYADPLESYCVALVVPSALAVKAELGISGTLPEIARNEAVSAAILAGIKKRGKEVGFEAFEIPQKIVLCPESWTPDNELVTAALKLKRNVIYAHYRAELDRVYKA